MTKSDELLTNMRGIAVHALRNMYTPREGLFVFRWKKGPNGMISEGLSRRYTAIVLIALANEESHLAEYILSGQDPHSVCRWLEQSISAAATVGDVALTLWAWCALNLSDRRRSREMLRDLLIRIRQFKGRNPYSWAPYPDRER